MPTDTGWQHASSTFGQDPARQRAEPADDVLLREGETAEQKGMRLQRRKTIRSLQAERSAVQAEYDSYGRALEQLDEKAKRLADEHQADVGPLQKQINDIDHRIRVALSDEAGTGIADPVLCEQRAELVAQVQERTSRLERETADIEAARQSTIADCRPVQVRLSNIPTLSDLGKPGIADPRKAADEAALRAAAGVLGHAAAGHRAHAAAFPEGSPPRFRITAKANVAEAVAGEFARRAQDLAAEIIADE